jgi:hypothetical protein
VRLTVRGEVIVLSDVPQGACPECGSRVYKARVLEGLETVHADRQARPLARFA